MIMGMMAFQQYMRHTGGQFVAPEVEEEDELEEVEEEEDVVPKSP